MVDAKGNDPPLFEPHRSYQQHGKCEATTKLGPRIKRRGSLPPLPTSCGFKPQEFILDSAFPHSHLSSVRVRARVGMGSRERRRNCRCGSAVSRRDRRAVDVLHKVYVPNEFQRDPLQVHQHCSPRRALYTAFSSHVQHANVRLAKPLILPNPGRPGSECAVFRPNPIP